MPTTLDAAGRGRVLAWLPPDQIEDQVRDQALRTAGVACVHGHVALMPDAHLGKGATIGSVIPTAEAIIPSAVGVDIGCGVVAAPVQDLTHERLPDDLDPLVERWARAIPAGLGQWSNDVDRAWAAFEREHGHPTLWKRDPKMADRAPRQLGTLGSGNHFLELCTDEAGQIWVMLHSGSRGAGNRLAMHHIERAKGTMRRWSSELTDPDLAYLVQGQPEFDAYIHDLQWAQAYARVNRDRMMHLALEQLGALAGRRLEFEAARYINNCLAGDTRVLTADGAVPIRDLVGGVHEVLTTDGEWVKAPVQSYGEAPVLKLTLSRSGVSKVIYATPEHRWVLRGHDTHYWTTTREVTTAELQPLDRLAFSFPAAPANGMDAAEQRGWTVVAVEWTGRVEEVFCATVDDTHTFTLEDNILTGNSHNYAALEEHDGRQLWITRKGAISARPGQLGVIPGSMGTGSYIVRGRGNAAAYHSAAHGAGRRMSRTKARKTFTIEDMERVMQGRVWQRAAARHLIDEIPGAYKDLDQVMAYQHDLVEVVAHLRTLVNYKGT